VHSIVQQNYPSTCSSLSKMDYARLMPTAYYLNWYQ
jgi:hypothetical protein